MLMLDINCKILCEETFITLSTTSIYLLLGCEFTVSFSTHKYELEVIAAKIQLIFFSVRLEEHSLYFI